MPSKSRSIIWAFWILEILLFPIKRKRKKDVWLIACNACTLVRRTSKANVSMDMVLNRTQLITALRTKLLGKEMAIITQTSH